MTFHSLKNYEILYSVSKGRHMQTMAIIGAQWGDEGKGKITDYFSKYFDYVVRFQGGNNAGHTIIVGEEKTVLHIIPSGILNPNCHSLIAHGVVFNPEVFKIEVENLKAKNISVTHENLSVSLHCNIITSYHQLLDQIRDSKGSQKIGTTGKGIGPAYEDRSSRRGIKLIDLFDKEILRKKLKRVLAEKEILFKSLYNIDYPSLEEETEKLFSLGQYVFPFAQDTFSIIDKAIQENKKILYEGAQGVLLDIDYGTFPFVTSSNTSAGGVYTGAGLPGKNLEETLGIFKAYTTRVGEGPFPTEMKGAQGEKIQKDGHEFGATTGRTRKVGWLDLPLIKYAIKSSNITAIALTKIDILINQGPLKICTHYEYEGKKIEVAYPGLDLEKVTPHYKDFPELSAVFENEELESKTHNYIKYLEEQAGIPIKMIAYGPRRSELKILQDIV